MAKPYRTSKEKDKSFMTQIRKPPNVVAAGLLVSNVPLATCAVIKLFDPESIVLDPSVNPAFFAFVMLGRNVEWWSYSKVLTSLLDPIIRGIHHESDRRAITAVEKVSTIAKRVPIVNLVTDTVFIVVPAVIGGALDNDSVLIFTFFLWLL